MIGMLRGHVESVDAVSAIIEVGGVGYEVRMPTWLPCTPARKSRSTLR